MAEIALIYVLKPLIQGAVSHAGSLAAEPIIMACCWKEELARLQNFLKTIQGVLRDAEARQESDPVIKDWLRDLQDVAYDAEDVLDEYAYRNLQRKAVLEESAYDNLQHKVETGVQELIHVCTSPFFYLEMSCKIKNINKRLSDLISRSNPLNLMATSRGQTDSTMHTRQSARNSTDSVLDPSEVVVGRDHDVSEIVNLLTNLRTQHHLSAVSIIGMAGVGKTTLAKSIYEEVKKEKLYDEAAWVCVSDEFDARNILSEMLEHFNRGGGQNKNMNVLVEDLTKNLKDKTFLLILDDVWNENANKWDSFCSLLSKIVSTASVVITTRNEGVASIIENELPTHMHRLQELSAAECWSIIEEKVPKSCRPIPQELQLTGRAIAEKCGGLPLVAAVIGGTLSKHINNEAWLKIKDSNAWDSLYANKILPVLKISFDHLRAPLKKCFSYCSIFPKDSAMGKDDLIQLWMAQGFLGQSNDMEEIGNQYFDELLSNSLFQDVVRHDQLGHIVSCKMHDVVHDLALSISQSDIFIWEAGSEIDENSGIRHLRVKFDGQGPLQNIPRGVAQRLRTLICDVGVFSSIAFDWRSLRSLKLLGRASTELPSSLGKLKHMKYLNITESDSNILPKSFSKLYSLQTLRLCKSCFHRNVEEFPDSLTKLICLRHICYSRPPFGAWKDNLQNLPRGIGRLTSLKTLRERFYVGNEKGYRMEELGCLSQLEGELEIEKLEQVRSKLEATEAKLKEKTKLYALGLSWTRRSPRDALCREGDYNKEEEVLDALQPHSNLKSLTINNYPAEKFPWWIAGNVNGSGSPILLNNLVVLTLGNCSECTLFPDLGRLPNLQHLSIFRMSKVSNLRRSDNQEGVDSITLYPALKTLHIRDMESLEEGVEVHEEVEGEVVLPRLELLSIFECPRLKIWNQSRSTQLSKVKMRNCGNLTAITFMDGLTSLKKLNLVNCHKLTCLPSRRGSYISLTTLTILKIACCQKLNIPEEWLGRLTSLTKLRIGYIGGFCSKLTLDNSSECTLFPVLGLLPNLQHLHIYGMSKVRSMGHKFNLRRSDNQDGVDSITLYPALKTLDIMHMDSLEEVVEVHEDVGVVVLPCLEELSITNCPRLKTWNHSRSTQLSTVAIRDCPNLAAIQLMDGLTSLKYLRLDNCEELNCLPNRLGSNISLTSLYIQSCKKLSIPEDCLGRLTSLKNLGIGGFCWEKFKSLRHQLQHLTALKRLIIEDFNGLEALPEWTGNFSSLRELQISRCKNLTSLPSVEAMRQLSNLNSLHISYCPKLRERNAMRNGPEWSKITHIPYVNFDGIRYSKDFPPRD